MSELKAEFYGEFDTAPIDAEKISESETKRPFEKELTPRGTLLAKYKSENSQPGMMYTERYISGRSMTEKVTHLISVWGGKFECDRFGDLDLKGSRHERPFLEAFKGPYGENQIRALGLYDEHDIEYIVRASELLRSKGLPTENPVNIYKLKEILVWGEPMQIDEWKRQALGAFKRMNPDDPALVEEAGKWLQETDFYEVERELQTSERLWDVALCQTKEEFEKMMGPIFKWVNAVTTANKSGVLPNTEMPDNFDINKPKDIQRYFGEWLPSQMGIYLARERKNGISNDYHHGQNWSAVGTSYDSQSVKSAELGTPVTEEDYQDGINRTLGALEGLLNPEDPNYLRENYASMINSAKAALIKAYLTELDRPLTDFNYEYFMNNTYTDGHKTFQVFINPRDWRNIVLKMGMDDQLESGGKIRSTFLEVAYGVPMGKKRII